MAEQYRTFKEFYPFYLSEHLHPVCRGLHFIGSWCVVLLVVLSFFKPILLIFTPIAGYGCAWIGHFFFEKNRPATFTYPKFSFMGDWVMFKDIIIRRESIINPEHPEKRV